MLLRSVGGAEKKCCAILWLGSREYGQVTDLVYYLGRSVKEVVQIAGTDKQSVKSRR